MSPIELIGVIFGLLTVYFSVKQNIWTWPTGIVSVSAFGFLFFEIKLYADMCLQLFFLWSCIQGWYFWLHGGENRAALRISLLTLQQRILIGLGVIGCVLLIGFLFSRFTDAALPYLDSTASGMSVVAQLLMMRKKLEHWYLWITVDVLSIGIYIYKDIPLTAGLYFVFLLLCIKGLKEWKGGTQSAAVVNGIAGGRIAKREAPRERGFREFRKCKPVYIAAIFAAFILMNA